MQGWKILKHSWLQVFANMWAALRISAILFAIQVSFSLYLRKAMDGSWVDNDDLRWILLLSMLVSSITSLWIAVAWHRYILTGEISGGWLPKLKISRMWSYFLHNILIVGVAMVPLSFVFGIIIGVIWAISLHTLDIAEMIRTSSAYLSIPFFFIIVRLIPILPAAALGEKLTLKEAWKSTKGSTGTIALLLVIVVIFYSIATYYFTPYVSGFSFLSVFWVVIVGWIRDIFGLSVISTMYGHYVEGRELT